MWRLLWLWCWLFNVDGKLKPNWTTSLVDTIPMELQLFFVNKSLDVGYLLVDFPVCKHVRFSVEKKSLKRGWKMRWRLPLAYLWRRLRTEDCICREEIRLRTTEKTPKNNFSLNKKTKPFDQMKSDLCCSLHNKFCVLKKTDITIFSLGRTGLATTDGSTRNTTALGAVALCQSHHLCSLPRKRNMEREREVPANSFEKLN